MFGILLTGGFVPKTRQIEMENKKRYPRVYAHELAHQTAAGDLGGPIVIEKNNEGLITGGHVNIKMPSLDPQNPEKTKSQAQTVINAAMAPSDPSSQDFSVAAQAQQIFQTAQKAVADKNSGKNLDIIA